MLIFVLFIISLKKTNGIRWVKNTYMTISLRVLRIWEIFEHSNIWQSLILETKEKLQFPFCVPFRLLHWEEKEAKLQVDEAEFWSLQRNNLWAQEYDWRCGLRGPHLCRQCRWPLQAQYALQTFCSIGWVKRGVSLSWKSLPQIVTASFWPLTGADLEAS